MNTQLQPAQAPAAHAENFFRNAGGIAIKMPALQRPVHEELPAKFPWIYGFEYDTSPTDTSFLALWTVLREDELNPIQGDEYKRRVAATRATFFGYQHADLLVEGQDEFPEFVKIFEEECEDNVLYAHPYVDFLGLIVLDKDRRRFCPRISVDDKKRLFRGWTWLDRGFRPSGRIAVAGSLIPFVVG